MTDSGIEILPTKPRKVMYHGKQCYEHEWHLVLRDGSEHTVWALTPLQALRRALKLRDRWDMVPDA